MQKNKAPVWLTSTFDALSLAETNTFLLRNKAAILVQKDPDSIYSLHIQLGVKKKKHSRNQLSPKYNPITVSKELFIILNSLCLSRMGLQVPVVLNNMPSRVVLLSAISKT